MNKEQAIRLGIKIKPIKHSMKRRAFWHDYSRAGLYMITIHVKQYEDGSYYEGTLLSRIEGDPEVMPAFEEEFSQPLTAGKELLGETSLGEGEDHPLTAGKELLGETSLGEGESDVPWAHPVLTPMGRFVDAKIQQIPLFEPFRDVEVKSYVIMPTHIHMIVEAKKGLPYWVARHRQYHFGDLVRGFKQGCTSLMKMWLSGMSEEEVLQFVNEQSGCLRSGRKMERTYTTVPGGESEVSLWEDGYNDRNLVGEDDKRSAYRYVYKNAYYWRLRDLYPNLFEHALHLKLADADYTAYGCMFLLERDVRKQVMCHRLARKCMLTEREWQLATQSMEVVRAYEKNAKELKLGHFDWDWYRSNDPNSITAVDYTRTEAFRQRKAELLKACEEENAVLVSPVVSMGERKIIEEAIRRGFPVIKLYKKAITEKSHPLDSDRDYCAKAQMLVLGPWEIKEREILDGSQSRNLSSTTGEGGGFKESKNLSSTTGKVSSTTGEVSSTTGEGGGFKESAYAKFHNLNDMAADLCAGVKEVKLDMNYLYDDK